MLTKSRIVEIEQALEDSQADLDDFLLDVTEKSPNREDRPMVVDEMITWRYYQEYRFVGEISSTGYKTTFIPGSVILREEKTTENWPQFLSLINSWVNNIYTDLMAKPLSRQVKSLREDVDELLKQVDQIPDYYFSREEGEELRKKLDDLEESFAKYYEQNEEDKEEAQRELDELRKELEFLRATTYYLTKRNWARLALKKLGGIANSPAGKILLREGAPILFQKLLPPPG